MPQSEKPSEPKPRKRGLFRRMLRWAGIFLLVVAIFHRPLFHTIVRLVLVKVAAQQNIQLDLNLSGTIFTNLTVSNVHAAPTGQAPSPVHKIDIERVRLDFSVPLLIKHGIGEFLRSYEISNANIEIDVLPSKTPKAKTQNRSVAENLNNILGQPAAYSDRVNIQNFNITVRAEKNVTQVAGFSLVLDPEKAGYLKIARLQIPGLPLWENLAAETSYTQRNFFIKELTLSPQIVIEQLNFDASQRAQHKGGMDLKARVFGGTLHLALSGSQLNKKGENLAKSYDTTLRLEAADVSLEEATAYFGAPKPPVAKLSKLDVLFLGEPEKPRTWNGHLNARVETIAAGAVKIDGVDLGLKFTPGQRAELTGIHVAAGKNAINLTATLGLPESVNNFPQSDLNAQLQIDAPDLPALTAMMPDPLTGRISGGGPIKLIGGKIETDLTLDAQTVAGKGFGVDSAKLHLVAKKRIDPKPAGPFDDLTTRIVADVTSIRVNDFTIDSVKLDAENQNDLVTLTSAEVHRAENSVTAKGTYRIPADLRTAASAPLDAQFAIHLPKVEDFGIKVKDHPLLGRLESEGVLKTEKGLLNGRIQLDSGDFQIGEFKTGPLEAKVEIKDNIAEIQKLGLQLTPNDQLAVTGQSSVQPPFPYEAAVQLDIKDLGALQSLLTALGMNQKLAGALHLDWTGKGEAAPVKPPFKPGLDQTGQLNFALTKGRFDKIDLTEIKVGGIYGPGFAQTSELQLKTGPTGFTGNVEMKEGKLRIKDLSLTQGDLTVLTGFLFLPFDLNRPQQIVPLDERMAANINTTNLDLEKLLSAFGQTSPVKGTITANVVAGGTPLQPLGHLKFAGRGLQAKAVAQLDPADLDLDLHYSNKELTLNAVAKQPQIQPLTIKGHVPLDLEATVQNKKLDPELPIDLTVQLPSSSLAVVSKLSPQVRKIEGTVGIDARVAGTVGKPVLSGSAALDLVQARMEQESIPVVRGFKARLGFAEDTLTFQTFEGEVGGGTFKLSGTVKLPKLTEPVFNLRMQSDEVLVMRNDSITVRADTDVTLVGPLASATVGGRVSATHSRFFKEIDILPIAMPGKAKPAPKTARAISTGVSFPKPPLRDWKFDLAIRTDPNDEFLIRGNLANGAAAIDLKLLGTGLAPYLEGSVRVTEFKASLPFSTLTVSRGFVYFNKEAPFQPSLEIQADSQTRDYLVHAYIYGPSTDPQIQLSSEPPLPYSDIVSLLATGVTASELTGNADVLASKAAMLAVQQVYRKLFRKGAPPAVDKKSDGDFLDRFQLELGALDSRTGSQQVISRVRLTDQLYLIGDVGTDGGFTGRLKYLIRFR